MFKLISLSGDNIRLDEKAAGSMLTHACARSHTRIEGIIVLKDLITVICSDDEQDLPRQYNFTQLGKDVDCEDIFAAARSRYDNNFRTVGTFQLADGYWYLTEKTINNPK